jgi:SCP-2 sterol transfer family protein
MPHPFLSDEWFAEVEKIRGEVSDDIVPAGATSITLNVVVTDTPGGDRDLHIQGGNYGVGHVDGAPTKATIPYDVARQLLVDGNPQAAMQAFMSGQLRIEGDMSQLMMMQSSILAPNERQLALQERLRAITA